MYRRCIRRGPWTRRLLGVSSAARTEAPALRTAAVSGLWWVRTYKPRPRLQRHIDLEHAADAPNHTRRLW